MEQNDLKQSASGTPRISIICPVWNVKKYIAETIDSVIAEDYPSWELLIMDGGSKDGTIELVESYAARDSRIKIFSEKDEGPWHATDKGIDRARGEFMCIVGGQDGFLDKHWLSACIEVLDQDPSVAMVWGAARPMSDDGKLLDASHVTYSHFMGSEGAHHGLYFLVKKAFSVAWEFLVGPMARKKVLFKKIFSKTAPMRVGFLTRRGFPEGKPPVKEEWFAYWLETGFAFFDQGAIVSKRVYKECAPRYPMGTRMVNHMTEFNFNFNSKGYLSYYLPSHAIFGRIHPGNSADRVAGELHRESEKYMRQVLEFKNDLRNNHRTMVFRDRAGNQVSTKKF